MRIRRSILTLQQEHANGKVKPLDDLMYAWKGIKELDPSNPHSFFQLGGYHGEPLRGAGWGDVTAYWGGYCHHGNILFPTWHRMYLFKLEEALRSIEGCEDVTMPYWDESDAYSIANGIPSILTDESYSFSTGPLAKQPPIPNPLRSYVLPMKLSDFSGSNSNPNFTNYTKPKGYETVRYPLSGLVGTKEAIAETAIHNAKYPDFKTNVGILNENMKNWLNSQIIIPGEKDPIKTNVVQMFKDCLDAPNYTVFSNTTSAHQWNSDVEDRGLKPIVPLESPHNKIHLAVGGCDVPGYDMSPISGANGDMGENNTAGFDPIFHFHHCNIDRIFWIWQQRHGATRELEFIKDYPGTNSSDSQGPTPGVPPNAWLDFDFPLQPFKNVKTNAYYKSTECFHIQEQLGYDYEVGSLSELAVKERGVLQAPKPGKTMFVNGINRAPIRGSFLISAFVEIDGKQHLIGTEAVLSRWNVQSCANCQMHLEVKAAFGLHDIPEARLKGAKYVVQVHGRDGLLADNGDKPAAKGLFSSVTKAKGKSRSKKSPVQFKMEVR